MKDFLRRHAEFREGYVRRQRAFLESLASHHQSPAALYVGCSDSRVIPELLTGSSPGELFVVRNVANLVPAFDRSYMSVGAALEYGVEVLHVPYIVVCGHYGCGGVGAMIENFDGRKPLPPELSSLRRWLAEAAEANAIAKDTSLDPETRWRKAVEENVTDQMANLLTYPGVRKRVEAHTLDIHGWVYDLANGAVQVFDARESRFVDATAVLSPSSVPEGSSE